VFCSTLTDSDQCSEDSSKENGLGSELAKLPIIVNSIQSVSLHYGELGSKASEAMKDGKANGIFKPGELGHTGDADRIESELPDKPLLALKFCAFESASDGSDDETRIHIHQTEDGVVDTKGDSDHGVRDASGRTLVDKRGVQPKVTQGD